MPIANVAVRLTISFGDVSRIIKNIKTSNYAAQNAGSQIKEIGSFFMKIGEK